MLLVNGRIRNIIGQFCEEEWSSPILRLTLIAKSSANTESICLWIFYYYQMYSFFLCLSCKFADPISEFVIQYCLSLIDWVVFGLVELYFLSCPLLFHLSRDPMVGMLKLLTMWRITSHSKSLDDKLIHEDIEDSKFWFWHLIYQRMNETFFVTLSFLWRLLSPSGHNVLLF